MMYKLLSLILLFLTTPTLAQETRAQLQLYNDQHIYTNGKQLITGYIANQMNTQIIGSIGVLLDTNVWTGSNSFTGPFTFGQHSLPNVQLGDAIPATGQPYVNSSGFVAIAQ